MYLRFISENVRRNEILLCWPCAHLTLGCPSCGTAEESAAGFRGFVAEVGARLAFPSRFTDGDLGRCIPELKPLKHMIHVKREAGFAKYHHARSVTH